MKTTMITALPNIFKNKKLKIILKTKNGNTSNKSSSIVNKMMNNLKMSKRFIAKLKNSVYVKNKIINKGLQKERLISF